MSGKWVSPQFLAMALLLGLLLAPGLRRSEMRFAHPVWFSFFSFGVLAASFAPPIYATGVDGYLVERVLSSLYMLFVILAFLNVIYWTGFMVKRFAHVGKLAESAWRGGLVVGQCALCGLLLIWGMLSTETMNTPSASACAAKSLITGEAALYWQEMGERQSGIVASQSPGEAKAGIRELTIVPSVFPYDKVPGSAEGGRGMVPLMYRYFRMHELAEAYGAGNIPQSEWDALQAWAEK
jgi:hypothetical protein